MQNSAKLLSEDLTIPGSSLENRYRTASVSHICQPGIRALLFGQGQGK
jgi:hypothetical protein